MAFDDGNTAAAEIVPTAAEIVAELVRRTRERCRPQLEVKHRGKGEITALLRLALGAPQGTG